MWNSDSRSGDSQFVKWAKKVKIRDQFTCQICERQNVYLNSHHKNSWDHFVEQRYNVGNGTTLCASCHKKFHELFGYGNNTELQFNEFRLIAEVFKKILRKKRLQIQTIVVETPADSEFIEYEHD